MDLHALAIPTYVQMLKGLSGQLTKGEAFAADNGLAPEAGGGLSMGMSDDFETAIMLGATHVRVGSALFGARS